MQLRLDLVLQSNLFLATSLGSIARPRASYMTTPLATALATAMVTAMATAMTDMGDVDAVETMSGMLIKLWTLRDALGDVHPLCFEKSYSSRC